jgi:POT family proton-dependent oligopeptide transporter
MLAGLGLYTTLRPRLLHAVGSPPPGRPDRSLAVGLAGVAAAAVVAILYHTGLLATLAAVVAGRVTAAVLAALALVWTVRFVRRLASDERGPTVTIFVFMLFNAVFWLAFEQAGSSLNLFTDTHTDRRLGAFEVPTTWFQSVNAGLIFLLAPLFAAIWSWLGRRGRDPSQAVKIALGLFFLAFGYVFMVIAGRVALAPGVKAPMALVLATYFWHTVGELCLSPTGLSYVTKAAPQRFVSLLMGIWFVSTFLANLGGGLVAAQVEAIERGGMALPWHLGGQADFFMLFVVSAAVAGVAILCLAPRMRRLAGSDA